MTQVSGLRIASTDGRDSESEMGCGGLAEKTMTDENELEGQSRRSFLKTTGAIGAAATTGVAAFGGQAAAQQTATAEIKNVSRSIFRQAGNQAAAGLIIVQVQNVAVSDVVDANVAIGGVNVDVEDIQVLSDNKVKLVIADTVDVVGNNVLVAVNLLGVQTVGGQTIEQLSDTDRINVRQ